MTLLPPFIINGSADTLLSALREVASSLAPFSVETAGDALFGPNKDVPVSLIKPNQKLEEAHKKLAELVTHYGLKYEHPSISEGNYKFHITTQRGEKAPGVAEIPIYSFSLVDRQADGTMGLKQVLETFIFKEK